MYFYFVIQIISILYCIEVIFISKKYFSFKHDGNEDRNEFCAEFNVAQNFDSSVETIKHADAGKNNQTISNNNVMNSTFSAKFGHFNKNSYTSGLPYSGKVT